MTDDELDDIEEFFKRLGKKVPDPKDPPSAKLEAEQPSTIDMIIACKLRHLMLLEPDIQARGAEFRKWLHDTGLIKKLERDITNGTNL